jgi:hypothetical protein
LVYTFENGGNVSVRYLSLVARGGVSEGSSIGMTIEELAPNNIATRKVPVPEGQGVDIRRGRVLLENDAVFEVGLYAISPGRRSN